MSMQTAQAAIAPSADRLLGTWKMRSWTARDLATGAEHDALGANPRGYLTYTADGRVMVLVVARERRAPAELVPTHDEKVALYDSMFAYGGRFSFDGRQVTHHIDISWNEAWRGTDQVRFVELRGDILTYTSAPARNPMTGVECVHTVVFDRLSPSGRD